MHIISVFTDSFMLCCICLFNILSKGTINLKDCCQTSSHRLWFSPSYEMNVCWLLVDSFHSIMRLWHTGIYANLKSWKQTVPNYIGDGWTVSRVLSPSSATVLSRKDVEVSKSRLIFLNLLWICLTLNSDRLRSSRHFRYLFDEADPDETLDGGQCSMQLKCFQSDLLVHQSLALAGGSVDVRGIIKRIHQTGQEPEVIGVFEGISILNYGN